MPRKFFLLEKKEERKRKNKDILPQFFFNLELIRLLISVKQRFFWEKIL